jgi:hypothetical protein
MISLIVIVFSPGPFSVRQLLVIRNSLSQNRSALLFVLLLRPLDFPLPFPPSLPALPSLVRPGPLLPLALALGPFPSRSAASLLCISPNVIIVSFAPSVESLFLGLDEEIDSISEEPAADESVRFCCRASRSASICMLGVEVSSRDYHFIFCHAGR